MVFENRILRRIFGPKEGENKDWKKLNSEELCSLYCSRNVVRIIKYIRLKWTLHLARMEEGICAFKIITDKPK